MKALFLGALVCFALMPAGAHATDTDKDPTPLTAPSLNTFLQTLFAPVRESEKDWITRLDLTFTKLDLEKSLLAFQGGVAVKNSAWSTQPSQLGFSVDFASTADRYRADLNHAHLVFNATLATDTLALARYSGDRGLRSFCPESAPPQESEQDRDYRLAHCAFAQRLQKVASVSDAGNAFLDSVEDLTAQLSDSERRLYSTWAVVPEISGDTFHLSAKASGTNTMAGGVDVALTPQAVQIQADVVVDIDDAANGKIVSLAWTYLGALLDANEQQAATMRQALIDYAKSLRGKQ